jgi:hypothetical protein
MEIFPDLYYINKQRVWVTHLTFNRYGKFTIK